MWIILIRWNFLQILFLWIEFWKFESSKKPSKNPLLIDLNQEEVYKHIKISYTETLYSLENIAKTIHINETLIQGEDIERPYRIYSCMHARFSYEWSSFSDLLMSSHINHKLFIRPSMDETHECTSGFTNSRLMRMTNQLSWLGEMKVLALGRGPSARGGILEISPACSAASARWGEGCAGRCPSRGCPHGTGVTPGGWPPSSEGCWRRRCWNWGGGSAGWGVWTHDCPGQGAPPWSWVGQRTVTWLTTWWEEGEIQVQGGREGNPPCQWVGSGTAASSTTWLGRETYHVGVYLERVQGGVLHIGPGQV